MMTYSVKEVFYSLQGEGARAGRASVFCRFSGCNLWSGLDKDRHKTVCPFCDTDFVGADGEGGGKFADAGQLAEQIISHWPEKMSAHNSAYKPYVVFTGGEPLLQLDEVLIALLHDAGFEVAVETNGTLSVPAGVDWICVSPKQVDNLQQVSGNELKLLFPLAGLAPENFSKLSFDHFFLQAVDEANSVDHIEQVVQYCLQHPQWRLSLQSHKLLGLK